MRLAATVGILLFTAAPLLAQESFGKKVPSVTMSPAGVATVTRGKSSTVNLEFQVERGFHVNSNKPSAEYLIPTILRLDPPTDIVIGKTTYPDGQEMSFAFAPNEKLSVYSGTFTVAVSVRPLASVLPSKYELRGTLRYQACDNAACYPPKTLPVKFEVKVVKAPAAPKKNPAQSPHAHS
ncbi:MAG TPA: protein-disulfide reductase DsbD domain-containing protein [Terriglobales bacterium]|nr:protein-disulfide reductase DsbD domain-containing protein [Terriglobales bacterium]